jgi:hypothetical protein
MGEGVYEQDNEDGGTESASTSTFKMLRAHYDSHKDILTLSVGSLISFPCAAE